MSTNTTAKRLMERASMEFHASPKSAYAHYIAVVSSLAYRLNVAYRDDGSVASDIPETFTLAHECLYAAENIIHNKHPDWRHTKAVERKHEVAVDAGATTSMTAKGSMMHAELMDMVEPMPDEETIPLVPLSPLCRLLTSNTKRLSKAAHAYKQAKQQRKEGISGGATSLNAQLRRLEEDVRMQRAKVTEVQRQMTDASDRLWVDWDVDRLARELSAIDASLFAQVDVAEVDVSAIASMLSSQSDAEPIRVLPEAIEACIDFERHIFGAVSHMLILEASKGQDALHAAVRKACQVVLRLYHVYRDLNAWAALLRVLASAALVRLPDVWNCVPVAERKRFRIWIEAVRCSGLSHWKRYAGLLNDVYEERLAECASVVSPGAIVMIPFLRAHAEMIRTVTRTRIRLGMESGAVEAMEFGTEWIEQSLMGISRCRASSAVLEMNSVAATPTRISGNKRKVFHDVDGSKAQVAVCGDLALLVNQDLGLQHWLLSRVFLTRAQLWEESAQVKSMQPGEKMPVLEEFVPPIDLMNEDKASDVSSDRPAIQVIRDAWAPTQGSVTRPTELPVKKASSVDTSTTQDGSMSVNEILEFLDDDIAPPEMILNRIGAESNITMIADGDGITKDTEEVAFLRHDLADLKKEATEELLRTLHPEFTQIREELERIKNAEADGSPQSNVTSVEWHSSVNVSAAEYAFLEETPASSNPQEIIFELVDAGSRSATPIPPSLSSNGASTLALELMAVGLNESASSAMSAAPQIRVSEEMQVLLEQEKEDLLRVGQVAGEASMAADATIREMKRIRAEVAAVDGEEGVLSSSTLLPARELRKSKEETAIEMAIQNGSVPRQAGEFNLRRGLMSDEYHSDDSSDAHRSLTVDADDDLQLFDEKQLMQEYGIEIMSCSSSVISGEVEKHGEQNAHDMTQQDEEPGFISFDMLKQMQDEAESERQLFSFDESHVSFEDDASSRPSTPMQEVSLAELLRITAEFEHENDEHEGDISVEVVSLEELLRLSGKSSQDISTDANLGETTILNGMEENNPELPTARSAEGDSFEQRMLLQPVAAEHAPFESSLASQVVSAVTDHHQRESETTFKMTNANDLASHDSASITEHRETNKSEARRSSMRPTAPEFIPRFSSVPVTTEEASAQDIYTSIWATVDTSPILSSRVSNPDRRTGRERQDVSNSVSPIIQPSIPSDTVEAHHSPQQQFNTTEGTRGRGRPWRGGRGGRGRFRGGKQDTRNK